MTALTDNAVAMLDRMEPRRGYEISDLRILAPELSADGVREVMHELWIAHEVERVGDLGWRRTGKTEAPACATHSVDAASLRLGTVKPEDLFDHKSFAAWFK
jgi:hypothetical protein